MPLNIVRQDITCIECDAIVNPTNPNLVPGGGIDAIIHQEAGNGLRRELKHIGYLPMGKAILTAGYNLPSSHIIHTAGPVWQGGKYGEKQILENCYRSCLELAKKTFF